MKLLFEKSRPGHGGAYLPACDVPEAYLPEALRREAPPRLPELGEVEISRHYSALDRRAFGVNDGFYPLGSCTMKYNPSILEEIASMEGFTAIHPLQPPETALGCREVIDRASALLAEITGMDAMTMQPAAGAQGELTGLLLIRAYHQARGDAARTEMLIPDAAHGTNPASAAMAGYTVVPLPTNPEGGVDLQALRQAVGPKTAGLMLTNPNTLGLFERDILAMSEAVHAAGGLLYYDGANLNAVLGQVRPGDMGFDVVHLNLHKTFATPHGGGGPGSGAVGCKAALAPFLPHSKLGEAAREGSIGQVKAFYGNFLVVLKALCYILLLGADGLPRVSEGAVLNANYLMHKIRHAYPPAYDRPCMHEFVATMAGLKKEKGVSALDMAKAMLDQGMHPPTMYFPQIVAEALMFEPTETEGIDTLDEAAETLLRIHAQALSDPDALHQAPHHTPVRRPDEVKAAREAIVRYEWVQEP